MKKLFIILFLSLALNNSIFSQCTITATGSSHVSKASVADPIGNSFTACTDGILNSISVLGDQNRSNQTMVIYEGEGLAGTVLATITNITLTDGSYTDIDVSGENIEVTNGASYTFYFNFSHGFSNDMPVVYNNGDSYAGGKLYYAGSGYDALELVFGIEIAESQLPVELLTFTANVIDDKIDLCWQTATEIDNYGFEILRSTQNDNWENVGFVKGAGNSNTTKSYSFTDKPCESGTYSYRLKQIDVDGSFKHSQEVEVKVNNLPAEFALQQNYPNPFNPTTVIEYSIPANMGELSNTKLAIYDMLGREIAVLVNKQQSAGRYKVEFDASYLSSGTYIYQLKANEFLQTKKLVLLK